MEYTRRIWEGGGLRLDYSGEFSPLFRESDPTMVATETTVNGSTIVTPVTPTRVIFDDNAQIEEVCVSTCTPAYAVLGKDGTTYAVSLAPIGARAAFLPRRRVQPTFEANGGFLVSSRDIPVDHSALLNYQFTFGPGVQVFASRNTAVRLGYVYRHISNANMGAANPGIDQGVFRLTTSRYR